MTRLWNGVWPAGSNDYVRDFVEELLRTGIMLSELLQNLCKSLPADAYPGESNAEVVFEMLVGTISPAVGAAGTESVLSATALLADSRARTLADLRRAAELANRTEPAAGQPCEWRSRWRSGRR
ncbi:MAG: hypothetical protein ACR2OB_08340 [Solirubrobacteraceae bacterium]